MCVSTGSVALLGDVTDSGLVLQAILVLLVPKAAATVATGTAKPFIG